MNITIVPCLSDNYAYLVWQPGRPEALVVDPSQAEPVLQALRNAGLSLAGILCTHHHFDHIGGIESLLAQCGDVPVYGHHSEGEAIPKHSHGVDDGDEVMAAGLVVRVLHVPGHTRGGVAYLIEDAVFTGDTLFVAGCGRLFEGTAEQMHASLQKLAALPEATRLYCGHEYTLQNLEFAAYIEPGNAAAREKLERARAQRHNREPTVPSTIREELATNPFLRAQSDSLRRSVERQVRAAPTPTEVFAAVRKAKDRF